MTSARPDTRFLHVANVDFVTAAMLVLTPTGNVTDKTSFLSADDGSSVTLQRFAPAVGDYMAFGAPYTFDKLTIEITTNGVGTWTITWKYWDGSALADFSSVTDPSTGFTAGTGVHEISYDLPTDWAQSTIGGSTAYYAYAYISAFTSQTTAPQADYAKAHRWADLSQYAI